MCAGRQICGHVSSFCCLQTGTEFLMLAGLAQTLKAT